MKKELFYYDPMLYLSTPEIPFVMGITATLKEPIEGEKLEEAVERLRQRFPYFYVRAEREGDDLYTVPNSLPVTVRNTWKPINLHSSEANYHVMAVKYEGRRMAVEISHAMTDGTGFLPYFKSLLYCYLSFKTGLKFNSDGFRLPGDEIPKTETEDPFPGLDLDHTELPIYQKQPTKDFIKFGETLPADARDRSIFYLKLPEDMVMRYCKSNDGSPNVLIASLFSKAARDVDQTSERPFVSIIAIDNKARLGNYDSYRQFAFTGFVDFPKKLNHEPLDRILTMARGQLILQTQPENALQTVKNSRDGFEQMKPLPLAQKAAIGRQVLGSHMATTSISYVKSRSFGPLDEYIEEYYVLGEPSTAEVLCEITCINQCFFLAFSQVFKTEAFLNAFIGELGAIGIPCEIMRKEEYKLCGIRYDDISFEPEG